ncbi:MAG: hypothetical protein NTX25_19535 [Proteobacteria bacterium]|nr:hypothetical protein [Pseudomonadota bacterium]
MRNLIFAIVFAGIGYTSFALAQDDDADLGVKPDKTMSGAESLIDQAPDEAIEKSETENHPKIPPKSRANLASPAHLEAKHSDATVVEVKPIESSDKTGFLSGRRRPGASFGLGLAQVASLGKYNHYDYLYGKKNRMLSMYAGYYLGSFLFDLGLITRIGYYSANGHPLESRGTIGKTFERDLTNEVVDRNQKLELTLIPVQPVVELALSPFKTRWLILRGWFGMEFLYVQESLQPNLPNSQAESNTKTYANTGWNSGLTMGGMVSFSLNGLEPRSDYSLRSIGIDRFFISPFIEIVKTTQAKFGNFDRKNYGIAFSFEGLR